MPPSDAPISTGLLASRRPPSGVSSSAKRLDRIAPVGRPAALAMAAKIGRDGVIAVAGEHRGRRTLPRMPACPPPCKGSAGGSSGRPQASAAICTPSAMAKRKGVEAREEEGAAREDAVLISGSLRGAQRLFEAFSMRLNSRPQARGKTAGDAAASSRCWTPSLMLVTRRCSSCPDGVRWMPRTRRSFLCSRRSIRPCRSRLSSSRTSEGPFEAERCGKLALPHASAQSPDIARGRHVAWVQSKQQLAVHEPLPAVVKCASRGTRSPARRSSCSSP